MGMSCGICHHENEANEPICLECRHLYEERARNGTLPPELRPYSEKIGKISYAKLHMKDKVFRGGGKDSEAAHKEWVEKVTREILCDIGVTPDPSAKHLTIQEKHDQEVYAYLKTFD